MTSEIVIKRWRGLTISSLQRCVLNSLQRDKIHKCINILTLVPLMSKVWLLPLVCGILSLHINNSYIVTTHCMRQETALSSLGLTCSLCARDLSMWWWCPWYTPISHSICISVMKSHPHNPRSGWARQARCQVKRGTGWLRECVGRLRRPGLRWSWHKARLCSRCESYTTS